MLLNQFEKACNPDKGFIGPYERKDGTLVVCQKVDNAGTNGSWRRYSYFTIYQCKYCKGNAISENKNKAIVCSRYSECFSIHAGIQIAKDNVIHTRENPGIDSSGYYCWRILKLDENGNKISTGDGNKRMYIYEHRVIMEEYLGRKLKSWESVHHIDMVKLNNNISNLWLCTAKTHHIAHSSYNEICAELMINFNKYSGIEFNIETGKYYLINNKETQ